ncbi:MAG TPA: response regulator [Thermoguttaceae bacterium]|nr:response regulator [Thermoguttaceae bacterium]
MLVLSRNCDTVVRIGPDIKVKVLTIRRQRVKLGIEAPVDVRVWREEILPESAWSDAIAGDESGPDDPPAFPILVVEDDPDHAQLIAKVLFQRRFPQVTIAPTGRAAIEMLDSGAASVEDVVLPHLVLLDLNLPDMSGLAVLQWIRAQRRLRTVPVVILSGRWQDDLVADCLGAGANAFVSKSAHYGEFRESVARVAGFWKGCCCLPRSEAPLTT